MTATSRTTTGRARLGRPSYTGAAGFRFWHAQGPISAFESMYADSSVPNPEFLAVNALGGRRDVRLR